MVSVSQRRSAVCYLIDSYKINERRGCLLTGLSRIGCLYKSRASSQKGLRQRIVDIAHSGIRYGYKSVHIMLKYEGYKINKKKVYRLYCLEGLQLRHKSPKRKVSAFHRNRDYRVISRVNEAWAMDFVSNQLTNGNKFRILKFVDIYSRECLAAHAGKRLRVEDVTQVLTEICRSRLKPAIIHCDNGSELAG